jgi:RNA polymerase sigma-B factor
VLSLRFFHDWTQQQIAEDIGVTQMQVSRILSGVLERLRLELTAA